MGRGGGRVRVNPRDFDSYRESKSSTPAQSGSGQSTGGKWHVQDRTDDVTTMVAGGYSHDQQVPTTEFLIVDRDGSGGVHLAIDDMGNEIYNGPHTDKK